jgi:D-alanyl-D-alanine carboxypeptidase
MQHDPQWGVTVALTINVVSGDRLSFYASGFHEVFDQALAILIADWGGAAGRRPRT